MSYQLPVVTPELALTFGKDLLGHGSTLQSVMEKIRLKYPGLGVGAHFHEIEEALRDYENELASDPEHITKLVMENPVSRAAYLANNLRRSISHALLKELTDREISAGEMAEELGLSQEELARLLHRDLGGDLGLSLVVKAADFLGLSLEIQLCPK